MKDLNIALVTADSRNGVKFELHGEHDDCTSFMNWISIFDGYHYSYECMKSDYSALMNYDCVLFSGSPAYMTDITNLSMALKGKVVTMFIPEGDVSLYDKLGINSFGIDIYRAMNAVDILYMMEEDKEAYYRNITTALIKFIHVPIDERMWAGEFLLPLDMKGDYIVIYGDNNPNCPITVFGIAKRLKRPIATVCIENDRTAILSNFFGLEVKACTSKLSTYSFLRLLARSWVHFYPTRWIGSSRQSISCAVAGTPCIGSDRSHTQRRLFPQLACDIYDVDKMESLANKLYNDKEFYEEIRNYAWKQLEFYNMQNTKRRFCDAYSQIRQKWEKT